MKRLLSVGKIEQVGRKIHTIKLKSFLTEAYITCYKSVPKVCWLTEEVCNQTNLGNIEM